MRTIFVKPKNLERNWVCIDAEGIPLGRVAEKVATIARGKNKPEFAPHQEVGDYVIVVNAEKAIVTGNKEQDKLYYRYSGYPGGLTVENYKDLVMRKPTEPMEKAVRRMLPKGPLGNQLYRNVKIYAGGEHPHKAQNPVEVKIDYTREIK